ncbi:anthranilate phosphoribosyltransferase 1 [Cellulomonas chitinilytica]|uniref:Anthranilate phosphoribosyltransferase n=1 Tax=Cellulomonas chitinilytica TaxID=398759 RepID=A0A919NZQ3_9CELL|nr:anthranilate phosphoribosyltransferase [Cellulomonas chitinilytica]GIG20547.1 anthranilate phosphoribosyltransferase 1 [Cellulomonas chitinilytica]
MSAATTWSDLLTALVARQDLTAEQTSWAMDEIMRGEATPIRVAGFLVALRAKGETVDELTGLADAMLSHAVRISVPGRTVDIVGTGGDRAHTVNISTMSALVVAGAGLRVVKHGNRAASSSSGSADVLEQLGIRLDHPPERVAALADEVGITFCYAQVFHPSMRHAAAARAGLGIGTVFNFLGPLTNPAQPQSGAIGVADRRMAPLLAGVFAGRGTAALVFRGEDGLDEIAPTGPTRIWEVRAGEVREHVVDWTAELGVGHIDLAELRGADAAYNADVARRLLDGEHGAVRETVVLNAAAAIVADASLPGLTEGTLPDRLRVAADLARQSLDTGAAADVLARWQKASA